MALMAGMIIFPACFTYRMEVTSGTGLLFDTMANVFRNMEESDRGTVLLSGFLTEEPSPCQILVSPAEV